MPEISTDVQDNYELLTLDLDGTDIRNEFIAISIYENIFENDMTLSIDFLETKNYLEIKQFQEGVTLNIEYFSKYPPRIKRMDLFKAEFQCYSTERVKSQNQGKKIYRMHFITKEQHNQSKVLVSRPYRDQPTTDIITSLFSFSNPTVPLDIEPSEDFVPLFVVPQWNPWKTINHLSKDALKADKNDYVFFRDKEKYVCKPISILMEEPSIQEYRMDQMNLNWEYDKTVEHETIKTWKQEKALWNSLKNINSGLYGSRFHKYNGITKISEFLESTGKPSEFSSEDNLHIFDHDNYFNRENIALYRQDRLEKITAINEERLIVEVRSNTNLTVGKNLDIRIPTTKELSIIDANIAKEDDVRLTGKYLISKLRHQISRSDASMIYEVIKIR